LITRLFYTTDVHGSDIVFRKFVNAGKFYKANVVFLDGDLTGKAIVPIVKRQGGMYESTFLGEKYSVQENEVGRIESKVTNLGFYPLRTDEDQLKRLQETPEKVDDLFRDTMIKQMRRWIQMIEQNLKGSRIRCYVLPGNDDRLEIDKAIEESELVENPEGRVVVLDAAHEMISTGWSNPTPWDTPREESEEALGKRIEDMASKVRNMRNCIFNLHCPPYDTGIDTAPMLDSDLRQVVKNGQVVLVPVGSKSVRNAIEKHQPLLGLHGHIHESKGTHRIGQTLCINPGSEYQQGMLKGVIVNIDEQGVKSTMFTSG
jgi:Icc-related predicted phosphoesterase